MGKFLTPLHSFDYRPYIVDGKIQSDLVVLESNVIWLDDDYNVHIVPMGFVFDLASLPWWIMWALEKLGRHQRAAALHDWLYVNQTNSKRWSDLQFRQAMDHDAVGDWRKWLAWAGPAVGGWFAWRSKDDILIVDLETMQRLPLYLVK